MWSWGDIKGGISDAGNWLFGNRYEVDPAKMQLGEKGYMTDVIKRGIGDARGRQAPQASNTWIGKVRTMDAAQMDPAQQEQWRQQQWRTAQHLNRIASGEQQGAGELAANRAISRGLASQQALANMARGGGAALAARQAARTGADITAAGAGQAQQAALQDQAMALGQLGSLTGTARGQDIGWQQQQAQMQQQANLENMGAQNQRIFQQAGLNQATSLANMQARLQQTGLNDAAINNYLQQLFGMNQAELNARMQAEGVQAGAGTNLQQLGGLMAGASQAAAAGAKTGGGAG